MRPINIKLIYCRFSVVTTRWMDNDVFGHINNAVYNAWMDTAVTECFRAYCPGIPDSASIPVVAETLITFYRSIIHPAEVETGVRVDRIGNSSVCCGAGIFIQGEQEAAAWGHMIHVWVDRESNKPVPIPAEIRSGLEQLIVKTDSD